VKAALATIDSAAKHTLAMPNQQQPQTIAPNPAGAPAAPGAMGHAQGAPAAPAAPQMGTPQPGMSQDNFYERIQQIAEGIIDEKWDELVGEVKKIVDWKTTIETQMTKMQHDVDKLKEDFNVLHQGVLGKLEDYDKKMTDVGTELNAVGKVFKDVVPEFVENVKELSHITKGISKDNEETE